MRRACNLDELMFPVEEHPVYANVLIGGQRRNLLIRDKKAIVNMRTGTVTGVVGRNYCLVTNRQALDWAYQCCAAAFPNTKVSEWSVSKCDAPANGGHCFIDLAHQSAALDFALVPAKERPEIYGPFIRVTNSYNTMRALSFDIGFHRKVCSNGLILPQSIIHFYFTHNQSSLHSGIDFHISHEQMEQLQSWMTGFMRELMECRLEREKFRPLFCNVLHLRPSRNEKVREKQEKDWKVLSCEIDRLCDQYANELGENVYAVFNAITDFATRPLENACIRRDRHTFQRLAGQWLHHFHSECRLANFNAADYEDDMPLNN